MRKENVRAVEGLKTQKNLEIFELRALPAGGASVLVFLVVS